jgi:predicted transposase YbfD/YdcC
MAKINKFIVEYAEVFKGMKLSFDEVKPPKYLVKRFVKIVNAEVSDPRYQKMCTYPLEVVLSVAFLAVLGDCKSWAEIADFGNDYKKWLSKFLPLGDTMPIDDTYRRIFSLLDSNELSRATIKYITLVFEKIKETLDKHKPSSIDNFKLVNIDGKVARATGRMYNTEKEVPNLQTLNVYDASDGVSLFSIPILDKTNEIPVAQAIIEKMNLKNTIISMDSLHAQHKTFDSIVRKLGDFVIGLKGNQRDAFEEVNLLLTDEYLDKLRTKPQDKNKVYSKIDEFKEYFKISFSYFAIEKGVLNDGTPKWNGIKNIICYKYIKKKTGVVETRYFATTLNDLDLAVEAIVGRWDVENLLHRYLDMDFGEDDNKTMDVKAYNNLSIINKLCLSILKIAKPLLQNRSMRRIKKSMGRRLDAYLSLLLTAISPKELEKIMLEKLERK